MKKHPKITVATIVRNDPEGFLSTARSVLMQDYINLEWIVVDGLSTDLTSYYVKKLSPQISKYKIEKDSGIYNAMNKAIDMASGEWMFFMNADDTFFSCDTVSKYFENLRVGDDIVYSDSERREDNHLQFYRSPDKCWLGMFMDHQTVCARTIIYKKLRYDETYRTAGDYDLLSRAMKMGYSFRKIPWLVGCNRAYEVGASSQYIDRQNERIRVIKTYFGNSQYKTFLTEEYNRQLGYGAINKLEHARLLEQL